MHTTNPGRIILQSRSHLCLHTALALFLATGLVSTGAYAQEKTAPVSMGMLKKAEPSKAGDVIALVETPTVEAVPASTAPESITKASSQMTPAAGTPQVNAQGEPLVTNSFADTDLKQALSDVTAQTSVSIIADNTVQGTITLDLKNVPLERALRMMLQAGGYSYAKIDDYYLVGSPEPTNPNFYLFSRTELVQLRNVRPEVVLSLLSVPYGRYLSSEGPTPIVTARGASSESSRSLNGYSSLGNTGNNGGDPDVGRPAATYKIAITAPPSMLERIKTDIARLDVQRQQVMLEAMVLEISQDDLKQVGFNFGSRYFQFSTTGGGNNFAYSNVSNQQLVQIAALAQKGAVRLRANPRVATGDGQTANMEVGRENYYSITNSSNAQFAYNTLEVIRSGISLRITPRILDGQNEVTALVEPEVRDVTGSGANGLPEITFRRAATNVRVKDGESIVIGGLINEYTTKSTSKIPVLGDLPLIGGLFRGSNSRNLRNETVIIVTPRIMKEDVVYDGVQSPALLEDLQAFRNGQRRNPFATPLTPTPGSTPLPPLVTPEPGVPAPGAPTP